MNEVDSALSRVDAFANFYALNGGHASDEAKDAITLATEVHHLRARLQQVIIERDSWKSARGPTTNCTTCSPEPARYRRRGVRGRGCLSCRIGRQADMKNERLEERC